jgi:hypothetical protein
VVTKPFDPGPKAVVGCDRNVHGDAGSDDDSDNRDRTLSDVYLDARVRYLTQLARGVSGCLVGPQSYFVHLFVRSD